MAVGATECRDLIGDRRLRSSIRIERAAAWLFLLSWFAPPATARENVRLSVEPRSVQALPGEPVRLELTILADSAAEVRLHVPADPRLLLRAVERRPVQRTQAGVIVHRRAIIWQALAPGVIEMDAVSVQTRGRKLLFPQITITVSDPGS